MAAPLDQNYFFLLDLIAGKVGKDELMYTGFESTYGNLYIRPPKMLYARGDFRTIHVGWVAPVGYTNTSHYLLQVSDDNERWKELIFDGSAWGGELGTLTTVYSTTIAHTRIPYNNGAVQTLYYRAATVSKDGQISEWSESISGNTFFVEQSDIRDGYVWNSSGKILLSGEPDAGQLMYTGSGTIGSFGGAASVEYNNYEGYMPTGGITTSGEASISHIYNFTYTGSGTMELAATIYGPDATVSCYIYGFRVTNRKTYTVQIDFAGGEVEFTSGEVKDVYDRETAEVITAIGNSTIYCDPFSEYENGSDREYGEFSSTYTKFIYRLDQYWDDGYDPWTNTWYDDYFAGKTYDGHYWV